MDSLNYEMEIGNHRTRVLPKIKPRSVRRLRDPRITTALCVIWRRFFTRVFSAAATVKKSRMARDARIACAETLYLQTDRDKQVNKSVRRVRRIRILAYIYRQAPCWCPIVMTKQEHFTVWSAVQTRH